MIVIRKKNTIKNKTKNRRKRMVNMIWAYIQNDLGFKLRMNIAYLIKKFVYG